MLCGYDDEVMDAYAENISTCNVLVASIITVHVIFSINAVTSSSFAEHHISFIMSSHT